MNSARRAHRWPFSFCWAVLTLLTLPAHAQSGWYFAPEISYFYPDPSAFDESDVSLGINAGWATTGGFRFELGYHALRLIPNSAPGIVDQKSAQVGTYLDFSPSRSITAYVGAGLGASRTEFNGDVSTLPFATASAGWSLALLQSGRLRLDNELRARYSRDEDQVLGREDLVDGQLLFRLRYHFGDGDRTPPAGIGEADSAAPADDSAGVRSAAPQDRDHDGVLDARDRCPNTIPNVRVDADGCMLGT